MKKLGQALTQKFMDAPAVSMLRLLLILVIVVSASIGAALGQDVGLSICAGIMLFGTAGYVAVRRARIVNGKQQ